MKASELREQLPILCGMPTLLFLLILYVPNAASQYLTPVKWSGPNTLFFRASVDGPLAEVWCRSVVSNPEGCVMRNPTYITLKGETKQTTTTRRIPNCVVGTAGACWQGVFMELVIADGDEPVELGILMTLVNHDAPATSAGRPVPPRARTCTTETTALTLAAMHPGENASVEALDNLRIKCNIPTDVRIAVLTPTITYTQGAVSTITAPSTIRVDANVPTAVPITIKTRVDPSDVVAGTYTQSVVLRLEHD